MPSAVVQNYTTSNQNQNQYVPKYANISFQISHYFKPPPTESIFLSDFNLKFNWVMELLVLYLKIWSKWITFQSAKLSESLFKLFSQRLSRFYLNICIIHFKTSLITDDKSHAATTIKFYFVSGPN